MSTRGGAAAHPRLRCCSRLLLPPAAHICCPHLLLPPPAPASCSRLLPQVLSTCCDAAAPAALREQALRLVNLLASEAAGRSYLLGQPQAREPVAMRMRV